MKLPIFKYHPEPLTTGAIREATKRCECCDRATGYIYVGSIFGRRKIDTLCPWCIASGRAHEDLGLEFASVAPAETGYSEDAFAELMYRTPAFSSCQEIDWPCHCRDFCEYHGRATVGDFQTLSPTEARPLSSWFTNAEIAALGQGDEGEMVHYLFKFVCATCGERLFQYAPD